MKKILYIINDLKIIVDTNFEKNFGDWGGLYFSESKEIILPEDYERNMLVHEVSHYLYDIRCKEYHSWLIDFIQSGCMDLTVFDDILEDYDDLDASQWLDEVGAYYLQYEYNDDDYKPYIVDEIELLNDVCNGEYDYYTVPKFESKEDATKFFQEKYGEIA